MVLEAPFGTPTGSKCYRLPVSRCQREPKGRAKVSKSAGKLKLGSEGRKKQFFDALRVGSSVFLNEDSVRMRVFQSDRAETDFLSKKLGFERPNASKMEACRLPKWDPKIEGNPGPLKICFLGFGTD